MFVHTVAATVATMPETTASRDETAVSADFARMTETSSSYYYENSPASAMENRGGRGGDAAGSGQEQQDLQDQHEENGMPHVAEAATEAHTDEHSYRQSLARYYRCMAESCNVLLLGLVLGFACIFTYAWVDAFRKAKYDQAIGLVTVLFLGTVVCTCGYRRRLVVISQLEEERIQIQQINRIDLFEQWMPQAKSVPMHIRESFDYFVFFASTATLSTKGNALSTRSSSTALDHKTASNIRDDDSSISSTFGVPTVETTGSDVGGAVAVAEDAVVAEEKVEVAGGDGATAHGHVVQQQLQASVFTWAPSALTDCSVCLEAYCDGDRMCRLPCAHTFHTLCIHTWLDQQHVCPQCRFDLLPPDLSWEHSPQRFNMSRQPFTSMFGPFEGIMAAPNLPGSTPDGNTSAAAVATPYASYIGSPAHGASPLPGGNGRLQLWRSPHTFRAGNRLQIGTGNSSNHTAGSYAVYLNSLAYGATPTPGENSMHSFHPSPEFSREATTRGAGNANPVNTGPPAVAPLAPQQAYLNSPAYSASPLSAANFLQLRRSPRFMAGTQPRGTPLSAGFGRFSMFPPSMPPSVSFPALDVPLRSRSGTSGSGGGSNAQRSILLTPPTGRVSAAQPPPRQGALVSQQQLEGNMHQHQREPRHHQEQHRGRQPARGAHVKQGHGTVPVESQAHKHPADEDMATTSSPLSLPQSTPRRSHSQMLPPSGRPSTPFPVVSSTSRAVGGEGGGSSISVNANARSIDTGNCGRGRSRSNDKRLHLPKLSRRLRSSSCDAPGSVSPGLCVLGNTSPKKGREGGGGLDRKLGEAVLGGMQWSATTHPRVGASWDNWENMGSSSTRYSLGSEDLDESSEWTRGGFFEQVFMSGSSIAMDQHNSPNCVNTT